MSCKYRILPFFILAILLFNSTAVFAGVSPDDVINGYENRVVRFSDMEDCQWATEYVQYLSSLDIVSGREMGIFDPFGKVTREEFIKMTVLATGILDKDAKCTFSEISADFWAYPYVASAEKFGILDFFNPDEFGRDVPISRREMALIAYRALKLAGCEFDEFSQGSFKDDYSLDSETKNAVYALKSEGIIGGRDDGTFDPNGTAQRCESAKIICGLHRRVQNLFENE